MGFFTERFTTIANYFSSQLWPQTEQWKNILTWSFWTESYLGSIAEYGAVSLGFVLILLIILIFIRSRLKKRQRIAPVYDVPVNQLTNIIVLIVIVTIVYWFVRAQQVAYLSSRLIILFTILTVVLWLLFTVIYSYRVIPAKRKAYLEKERFFRYLPKK